MHWVLDMPLRFNNQKPVSLFANSGSFNLISENKYMSNQHRYNEQGNHLWTKPKPALQNKQVLIIFTAGHRQLITTWVQVKTYGKSQDLPRCIKKHPMFSKIGLSSQGFNPMGVQNQVKSTIDSLQKREKRTCFST